MINYFLEETTTRYWGIEYLIFSNLTMLESVWVMLV
jgi:hypothetical protein